jgi:hypothetical protein
MTPSHPSSTILELSPGQKGAIFLIDFLLLLGLITTVSFLASPRTQWNLPLHLLFPLMLLPWMSFILHRFWGTTPGHYAFGVEKRLPDGGKATRLYDWLFQIQPRKAPHPAPQALRWILPFCSLVFAAGTTTALWMRDPSLRPTPVTRLELFAPEDSRKSWLTLPFFYATGAFPMDAVEFDLPYSKGPPNRFIGRISMIWKAHDSRLFLSGPLTLGSPGTVKKLQTCLQSWFFISALRGDLGCFSARRELWSRNLASWTEGRLVARSEWFSVENPVLHEQERPRGIYLQTQPARGRVREIYLIVGPRMAAQAFTLDRPENEEGQKASELLRQVIGSLRVSSDLAAPRAFLDPKLASLRVGPKSSMHDLIRAEGHLLAKVSIEPKQSESFYHLAGLAITLYRTAKKQGQIELTASSKRIVKSALQYARDVEPESKRIREMERFEVEVDAR